MSEYTDDISPIDDNELKSLSALVQRQLALQQEIRQVEESLITLKNEMIRIS